MTRKIRVLHVVKWFYAGGAERLLTGLLQHGNRDRYEHHILSLSDEGERLANIEEQLGIPYTAIAMGRKPKPSHWLQAIRHVRRLRPDVIKCWLPPSNIAGGVIGKWLHIPVIWGIHSARSPDVHNPWQYRLSRWLPQRIVCCSQAVYDVCQGIGYDTDLLTIINNGVDTAQFRPRPDARASIRSALGIDSGAPLIGMAAEYVPIKRHRYFLEAAKLFLSAHPNARFMLCGKNVSPENTPLKQIIRELGIEERTSLLGIRNDMPEIYSALDIHSLVSSSESFGLATTEAMACNTLCVATETGIARLLLKDTGEVIPISDNAQLLTNAWHRILTLMPEERAEMQRLGRKRIIHDFPISKAASQYDTLYNSASAFAA